VLDVGCGTGTLLALVAAQWQPVRLAGIDPDPAALARAARRVSGASVTVEIDRGDADALPYADAGFDHVFSSFMLHHLEGGQTLGMLREVRRVLAPAGSLHLVDFHGDEHGRGGLLTRLHHGSARMRECAVFGVGGGVVVGGLSDPCVTARGSLALGLLKYVVFRASR